MIAIKGFDQRSNRIACEEIAEEERHHPHRDDRKHPVRPYLEPLDRENVHVKYHD